MSEEDAIACVPDSLYMFLRLLYGGQAALDDDSNDTDEASIRRRVLMSAARDLIYGFSGGKKWTPKHIGLAITLHQATRSTDQT